MGYIGQFPSAAVLNATQIPDNVITSAKIAEGTVIAADIFDNTITSAKMTTTGVSSGVYGNSTSVASITLDVAGRITSASNVTIDAASTGKAIAMAIVFG